MATFVTISTGSREAFIKRCASDPEDAPREIDGVRWWHVGRNASHDFYLGLDAKDQMWRTAFCAEDCQLCDCPWDKFCRCERLSVDEVFNRNRQPVKSGDQLYLGR